MLIQARAETYLKTVNTLLKCTDKMVHFDNRNTTPMSSIKVDKSLITF